MLTDVVDVSESILQHEDEGLNEPSQKHNRKSGEGPQHIASGLFPNQLLVITASSDRKPQTNALKAFQVGPEAKSRFTSQ